LTIISTGGDVIIGSDEKQIDLQDADGNTKFSFKTDSTPEMDVTGNFKLDGTGTIELESTGDTTIDASGDIVLDAAGKDISLTDGAGTAEFIFNLEDAPEIDVDGDFTIDGSGLIKLDSATNNIDLIGNVTASGNISGSGEITTHVGQHVFVKTSNTDADFKGDVVFFGGTTSMDAGKIYHYKSDGTWELADADAVATCDGLLAVALGAASDTNGMLLRGTVTLDHDPGAVGDVLFLSTTAGQATATAPSGNTDIVRVIGYCLDASNGQIWFNPSSTFVEVSA
jgi:hypothetical protein